MYTLLRNSKLRDLAWQEGLPMAVSLLIAELFFKFKSFTLELIGFLALWVALSCCVAVLKRLLTSKEASKEPGV